MPILKNNNSELAIILMKLYQKGILFISNNLIKVYLFSVYLRKIFYFFFQVIIMDIFSKDFKKYITSTNGIFKHVKDLNNYNYLEIENGLKIFFIEDCESSQSGAHMFVNVGHKDNPIDCLGLAHFLEHMLFMGSEKYPENNLFLESISTNGGISNAYTTENSTQYYFITSSESFLENLDIFSNFFKCPLFDEKYLSKELNAVNSEHLKNMGNDLWRMMNLFKKIMSNNFKKIGEQGYETFGTGNYSTLLETNENDINLLRKRMIDLYKKNYIPSKMFLVIYHNQIDNKFIKFVKKMFKDAGEQKCNEPIISKKLPSELIRFQVSKENCKCNTIFMESINKTDTVGVYWIVNGNKKYENNRQTDPFGLIMHILGNKSYGSLFQILRNEFLIHDLDIDIQLLMETHTCISMTFRLTKKGLQQLDTILHILIGYIKNLLENIKKIEIFKVFFSEYIAIKKSLFKCHEKDDILNIMQKIVDKYHINSISPKYFVVGKILTSNIEIYHKNIISALNEFIIGEMSIIVGSKRLKNNFHNTDKYYGTKYDMILYKIDENNKFMRKKYEIPRENIFVIKDLQINIDSNEYERLEPHKNVFIQKNNKFKTCYCSFIFSIRSNIGMENKKRWIFANLFILYILSMEKMIINSINQASSFINICISNGHVSINYHGHNEKMLGILQMILGWLFDKTKYNFDEKIYEQEYRKYIEDINNIKYMEPFIQLMSRFTYHTNPNENISTEEILENIPMFSVENMRNIENEFNYKNFQENFIEIFKTGEIVGVIGGSANHDIANVLLDEIKNIVDVHKNQDKILHETKTVHVPLHKQHKINKNGIIEIENMNDVDKNSSVLCGLLISTYNISNKKNYESDDWIREKIYGHVLEKFCSGRFSTHVRVEKEMGYIASIVTSDINCYLTNDTETYLCFLSQSEKSGLFDIIDQYIAELGVLVENIDDEEYKMIISGIESLYEKDFDNILQEINYYNNTILLNIRNDVNPFDINNRLLNMLQKIKKENFSKWATDIISNNEKISLRMIPKKN
jgi:secreted Zn-dependent insulinase-like peptidase